MTKPTGNPRGRPPLPGPKSVPTTIRLSPSHSAQLRALGKAWLVKQLNKAPHPDIIKGPSP